MTKKGKTMKRKPQAFELTDVAGEIGYRWPDPKADSCRIRRDVIDHLIGQVNEARDVAARAMAVLMATQADASAKATWGPPTGPMAYATPSPPVD